MFLTERRLRTHAALLALVTWTVYFWTIATPTLRDRNGNLKGTDFLHFYTLGIIATERRGDALYDREVQTALAGRRVPDAAGIAYLPLYPPQVSLLFAPFARLSYGWALGVWWLWIGLIYGACCYTIWRCCPSLSESGRTVALLALAYPAFFHLIAWGQTSAIALACFAVAYLFLRNQRKFAAGLALGCLMFKPQLGLAAGVVLLIGAEWRILGGAALSAVAQFSAGLAYFGVDPYRAWLREIWNLPALLPALEPRPYQSHNLFMFWSMLVPWRAPSLALYAISAAIALVWTIAIWRRQELMSVKYSALLFAAALIAPHLIVYDLVILAPAILLLADWAISQLPSNRWLGPLLYLVYLLPFVGPYARWSHIQVSVIAMSGLLYLIWKMTERNPAAYTTRMENAATAL